MTESLKFITLVKNENSYAFLPTIQTLNDMEQLILDRFIIYKYLVCHHKVIRFDYLLEKSVELLINIEIEKLEKELEKDKTDRNSIKNLIKNKLDKINVGTDILQMIDVLNKDHNLTRRMYRFFQIDDYWIINILRGKYFEILVKDDNECEEKERELFFILEELFTHSRKLKTIWKRDYEYINFIKDFFEKKKSDIERIFGDLVENLKKQGFMVTENYIGFIKSIQYLDEKVKRWRHAISKLEDELRRAFEDNNLFCASVLHKLSTGLSKELEKTLKVLIISEENNKVESSVKPFREVSNVANYLEEYICRSISFIVYYKEDLKREKILENLYDPFLKVIEYLVNEYRRMGAV